MSGLNKTMELRNAATHEANRAIVVQSLRKLGVSNIQGIATHADMNVETVRRRIKELVEIGKVAILSPSRKHVSAIYSMADIDDVEEEGACHMIVPAVQIGVIRDPMVAAIFGPAPVEVRSAFE